MIWCTFFKGAISFVIIGLSSLLICLDFVLIGFFSSACALVLQGPRAHYVSLFGNLEDLADVQHQQSDLRSVLLPQPLISAEPSDYY